MAKYIDSVHVKLPPDIFKAIKQDAKKKKTTISEVVRYILMKGYPDIVAARPPLLRDR